MSSRGFAATYRAVALLLALLAQPASAWEPVSFPEAIVPLLPKGHVARLATCSRTLDPPQPICVIVAARPEEGGVTWSADRTAPPRPLLIYQVTGGRAVLIARNDRVVLRRDDGGQCDPVEDGGGIAIKGRFLTIESGVACGQHWTENTTFWFDPKRRTLVWHSTIRESWKMNADADPDAEALVLESRSVSRADPRHPISLAAYVPS